MIECIDCGVFFFTPEGREDHDRFCIGYRPNENSSVLSGRSSRIRDPDRKGGLVL